MSTSSSENESWASKSNHVSPSIPWPMNEFRINARDQQIPISTILFESKSERPV